MFTENQLEKHLHTDECVCHLCQRDFKEEDFKLIRVSRDNAKSLFILFKAICQECNYDSVYSFWAEFGPKGLPVYQLGLDYLQQKPSDIRKNKYV
jgi:hypothetical protein